MRPFYYLFHLCLLLCLALPTRATHIVGGELDLQHQSNSTYRLTLTLYFDGILGNPGALDNEMTAGIFERGTNRRVRNLTLPLSTNSLVPYTDVACSNNGSLITRRLVYAAPLDLPATQYTSPNGYYAVVERCCRNGVIRNITAPGDAGMAYYLEFPAVVRNGQPFLNSSPRIFPPLSDYACYDELFYFDFGGQDADGDSLVYEMSTPLNGHATVPDPRPAQPYPAPYAEVRWAAGFSVNNQLLGNPTLTINRRTGRLTVRPLRHTQVQPTPSTTYVFGIKCSEFRNGVKIGEVRRDFQLYIKNCPRNATPQMTVRAPGSGTAPYRPGRDTLNFLPGQNRCLRFSFTDPDPSSQLRLELRAVNFPQAMLPTPSVRQGMVRVPGQPDTITSTLCLPECFNSRGRVFLLDVIVADNGCALPRRDTVRVAFKAQAPPNQIPSVAMISPGSQLPIAARVGDLVQFDIEGLDADADQVTLEMNGRGFTPASVGAQLSQLSSVPGRTVSRFSWRVDCRAAARGLHEFTLLAAASPCQERQVSTTIVVPIQVNYRNAAPELTSTFPAAATTPGAPPVVVRLPLGGVYEANLTGRDADLDGLTLSAAGEFDLAAAGMSLTTTGAPGSAAGLFRWQANCDAARDEPLEVTFTLRDNTCLPVPQQRVVRFEVIRPEVPEFRPPNVFTPNSDSINDYFELAKMLPEDFCNQRFASIKIFSRWGNLVYRSTNRAFRWNGSGVPEGVYYYHIEFTDKRRYKGNVTVFPNAARGL